MSSSLFQWIFQPFTSSLENKIIGFEDVIHCVNHPDKYILIHTLSANDQNVLIKGTLNASEEERSINEYLSAYVETPKTIIIYGRHGCDDSPRRKLAQFLSLGISDVYIYAGGLFEWLLLQDIYGTDAFPTDGNTSDILIYRPRHVRLFTRP